jgi:inosine triphosphate pyrophosphatase
MTSNQGKLRELREATKHIKNIKIDYFDLDLNEYQGTPESVAIDKIKDATSEIPFLALIEDTSLSFNAYKGLPGVYIKHFLEKLKPSGLYKMA